MLHYKLIKLLIYIKVIKETEEDSTSRKEKWSLTYINKSTGGEANFSQDLGKQGSGVNSNCLEEVNEAIKRTKILPHRKKNQIKMTLL